MKEGLPCIMTISNSRFTFLIFVSGTALLGLSKSRTVTTNGFTNRWSIT